MGWGLALVAAQWIGTVAAGAADMSAEVTVCVISPRTELDGNGRAAARVVVPRPTILTAEPLLEVRLERNGRILWQRRASAGTPIEGPISWPIDAVHPSQPLSLLLQPVTAAERSQFARIQLIPATERELSIHSQQMDALGFDPEAWQMAIDQALDQDQVALAWALLFAPQSPSSDRLNALRYQVWQQGCGGAEFSGN